MPLIEKNDSWPFETCVGKANDMIVFQDTLYVVGTFQNFNGEPLNGIFKWDGENIHSTNAPFDISNAETNSLVGVHCITTFNDKIVIGVKENFSSSKVYSLENNQWIQMGNALEVNSTFAAIEWNNKLYITGEGETPLLVLNDNNIWEPLEVPFEGTPSHLEVYNGALYCNIKNPNIGKIWKDNGLGFEEALPSLNFEDTESIDIINDQLYAFGTFSSITSTSPIINISNNTPLQIQASGVEGVGAFQFENQFYRCVSNGSSTNIINENEIIVAEFIPSYFNAEKINSEIIVYKGEVILPIGFVLYTTTDYNFSSLGTFIPKSFDSILTDQIKFSKHSTFGIINNQYYNYSNLPDQNEFDPNLMNKRVVDFSSFLVSAREGDQIKANATMGTRLPSNWFPGPVSDNYTIQTYRKYDRTWIVSQEEIQAHIEDWNSPNYSIPESIANWPGNGDFASGEPHMLAPFHDENQNSWYEPELGDYPLIRGVEAAFWITHGKETSAFPDAVIAEMHVMCYVEEEVENIVGPALFFHNKIINRSTNTYDSLRIGINNGFSLGYFLDNLIGCDSLMSASYVYNGDDFDESTSIENFDSQTPSLATIILSEAMQVNMNYSFGFFEYNGRPTETSDYYNYMQGRYSNGEYIVDDVPYLGDGPMVFDESPCSLGQENEITYGNTPGDRRLISAGELHTLLPNESVCFDFAYYFKPASGDNIETLCAMLEDIPAFHAFYNDQNYNCSYINNVDELNENTHWSVFPNPTTDVVTLQIDNLKRHAKSDIKVLDMQGREMMQVSPTTDSGNVILDLSHLSAGSYFIIARIEDKTYTQMVMRE
jgi:hypothetical protein